MKKIGFASKTYSIWELETDNSITTYYFLKNLSKKPEIALKKAKSMGCDNIEIHRELYGLRKTFIKSNKNFEYPMHVFNFGKHEDKLIHKCKDVPYMVWFISHDNEPNRSIVIANRVCELDDTYMIYNDRLRTQESVEFEIESERVDNDIKTKIDIGDLIHATPLSHINNDSMLIGTMIGNTKIASNIPTVCISIGGQNCNIPSIKGKGRIVKDKTCFIRAEIIYDVITITGISLELTPELAQEDIDKSDLYFMGQLFVRAAKSLKFDLKTISVDARGSAHLGVSKKWDYAMVRDWIISHTAYQEQCVYHKKQYSLEKATRMVLKVLYEKNVVYNSSYDFEDVIENVATEGLHKNIFSKNVDFLIICGHMVCTKTHPRYVKFRDIASVYLESRAFHNDKYDMADWDLFLLDCANKDLDEYTFEAMIDGYEMLFCVDN